MRENFLTEADNSFLSYFLDAQTLVKNSVRPFLLLLFLMIASLAQVDLPHSGANFPVELPSEPIVIIHLRPQVVNFPINAYQLGCLAYLLH